MSAPVLTLTGGQPASDAWALMRDAGVRHAVVLRASEIVGVISDRDLGGVNGGRARSGRTVADMMHEGAVLARPTTTIREAAAILRERRIGCLPIVARGRLVGIVTRTDLLARLAAERRRERVTRTRVGAEDVARRPIDASPNIDKHL